MTSTAAADMLGIQLRTLYRLINAGDIPAYRFGRVIRLQRADVLDFIERSRITPSSGE